MPAETVAAPVTRLNGVIGRLISPRTLTGWVVKVPNGGWGQDLTITVRLNGRLIGEGRPSFVRPDIVDDPAYMSGYKVVCDEDIPDAALLLEELQVEVHDETGLSRPMGLPDRERGIALSRLLGTLSPFGPETASALLRTLAKSPHIADPAKEALRVVDDTHFSPDRPAASASGKAAGEDRDLLMQFESLGTNCILGGIQRSGGTEPLSLWRFAGIGVDATIRALSERLRGIGSPEFTQVTPNPEGEYFTYDSRYHMAAHTFVFEGQVDYDRFYAKQCAKITFMARNLLEVIEGAQKILVIHNLPNTISDDRLHALRDAIARIGPAPLLYMRGATETMPPGSMVRRDDGILEGYVLVPQGELMKTELEIRQTWLAVFRQARSALPAAQPASVQHAA